MASLFKLQLLICSSIVLVSAVKKVCYPPYGCFDNAAPHDDPLVWMPQSPDKLNTEFLLYTRTNRDEAVSLDPLQNNTISQSGADWNRQTIFIVHGFNEKPKEKSSYMESLVGELLKHSDMNVIVVIWSDGAGLPYHQAAGNTRIVGAQLSYMMQVLNADTSIPYSKFHVIGFSLGAHVAGYAGQELRKKGIALGRITGLDPAGPFFEFKHPDTRLDITDADFVDAIHTDTKTLVVKGFGTVQPMGDVDFYPNGGYVQPGCIADNKDDPVGLLSCSHFRAVSYFNESINGDRSFIAYPCKSYYHFLKGRCTECPFGGCPSMGYGAIKSKGKVRGSFYSKTNSATPFGGYHYALTFATGKTLGAGLVGKVTATTTTKSGISQSFQPYNVAWYVGTNHTSVVVSSNDLSDMYKVKVKHNNYLDRWYLRCVVVKPFGGNKAFTGCYNTWLNRWHNEVKFHTNTPGLCPK